MTTQPPAVTITRDIVYGHARVDCADGREGRMRALKLDRYVPSGASDGAPRPVVVLAFGGAFHRGSKEVDAFGEPDERNTSIAEYCALLAQRGYVACSIDYRLVQEDPEPGNTPVIAEPSRIPRSRVDVVRRLLSLPRATDEMLWRGIEAASDDMAMAARFVIASAVEWNVDPARLALGGFSAGARTALNAAYGEKVPAAAVVSLSGYIDAGDLQRHVQRGMALPPVLLVSAEHDLDYIAEQTPAMVRQFKEQGIDCAHVRVPGAGHFYPRSAAAVDASGAPSTVGTEVERFLDRTLRHRSPS